MVVSLHKWIRRLLFAVLVLLFTVTLYAGIRITAVWMLPSDPYRVPQGHSLKVFSPVTGGLDNATFAERLKFFYWYGE
jgi:hypothetical protein